jgi:hypothetical protein
MSGSGSPEHREHRGTGLPAAVGVVDGRWLFCGRDGRLTAYAQADGGLLRWTELRPGGPHWQGPEFVATPGVTDIVSAQGANGHVHFVGRRLKGRGAAAVPEIVYAVQYQTGRPVSSWTTVGNPHKDPARAARLGLPAAAVSDSGTVYVFVRNASGGVTMRREGERGGWLPWQDIRGNKARDGLAATALWSGRIELFVPGDGPAMRWCQTERDGAMERRPNIHIGPVPGSATVVETSSDTVTYYWTDRATGAVHAHRPGGQVHPLGSAPATGRHAAVRTLIDGYDCTVLAHRTTDQGVVLACCVSGNEQDGVWWSPVGEMSGHQPALVHDGVGRLVLGLIGVRGELRIARQEAGPGLAMGPAVAV